MKTNIKLYVFILAFVLSLFYLNDKNTDYQDFIFGGMVTSWSVLLGLLLISLYKKINANKDH